MMRGVLRQMTSNAFGAVVRFVLSWAAVVAGWWTVAGLWLWTWGETVAIATTRGGSGVSVWHALSLPSGGREALLNPATTWPVGSPQAGAASWVWWACAVLLLAVTFALAAGTYSVGLWGVPTGSRWGRWVGATFDLATSRRDVGKGSSFATRAYHLGDYVVPPWERTVTDRVVIGNARLGPTWRRIAAPAEHHTLAIAPTRQGKGVGTILRTALGDWAGPMVLTSVKPDLIEETLGYRQSLGPVTAFDPSGAGKQWLATSGWSPVAAAATWEGADRAAATMMSAASGDGGGGDNVFFEQQGQSLLALRLFATNRRGGTMMDVLDTTEQAMQEALAHLPTKQQRVLRSKLDYDPKTRANIAAAMDAVLGAYIDDGVEASAMTAEQFDADGFVMSGGPATHYVVAPVADSERLASVMSAHLEAVLYAAIRQADLNGGKLPRRVLFVLDELPSLARIKNLPKLLATAAGQGVTFLLVAQDVSQLRSVWGDDGANTILSNCGATLVLGGQKDTQTLDWAAKVGGDVLVERENVSEGDRGDSVSTQVQSVPLLGAAVVREQLGGKAKRIRGVLIPGDRRPVKVYQVPHYLDRTLAARASMKPVPPQVQRVGDVHWPTGGS